MLKGNNLESRILYPDKLSFKFRHDKILSSIEDLRSFDKDRSRATHFPALSLRWSFNLGRPCFAFFLSCYESQIMRPSNNDSNRLRSKPVASHCPHKTTRQAPPLSQQTRKLRLREGHNLPTVISWRWCS